MRYYPDWMQRIDFRESARELGCVCSDELGPHTHIPSCPLFESPAQMAERLEEEHS